MPIRTGCTTKDATTGRPLWASPLGPLFEGRGFEGPRATPTVAVESAGASFVPSPTITTRMRSRSAGCWRSAWAKARQSAQSAECIARMTGTRLPPVGTSGTGAPPDVDGSRRSGRRSVGFARISSIDPSRTGG